MPKIKSVRAKAKYIRMSPHKIRRVIDQLRGRSYQDALMILEFLPYDSSGPIWQIIHSAAANAKHNSGLDWAPKLLVHAGTRPTGSKILHVRQRQ